MSGILFIFIFTLTFKNVHVCLYFIIYVLLQWDIYVIINRSTSHGIIVKNIDSGVRPPGLQSWAYHCVSLVKKKKKKFCSSVSLSGKLR